MEYNYAYSIERDDKGAYLSIDYYEWVKKKKGYGWGNHIKSQTIYAGDWLVNDQWDFIHIQSINDWHIKFYIVPDGETRSIPFEKFAKVVGSRGFEVIKNPLQLMESMLSANLSGIYRGVISKEVSDDHEFIIVKPKPHRGGIPFGVKPTPEQLERIFRKEYARQKALEEKERKKKPTMADILIGNIRALRDYAQKVYEAHRDGEYTISDTQKAEIDKQLEKKDKVINKLKKHW